jgi:pyruvate dehydrogenase E1 component alpha subunit
VGPLFDFDRGYRTKDEVEAWMARCPIKRLAEFALRESVCTEEDLRAWQSEFQREVSEAVAVAKRSPFPAVEHLLHGTY